MASYRIICTTQVPVNEPTTRAHIVAVGTGDSASAYTQYWRLDEVLSAMDRGDVFYTKSESTGKIALVQKYICSFCGRTFIRSAPDAVWDNNLDNLPICRT